MDDLRRLNHWVPAAYLAPFTDTHRKTGALWAYRRAKPAEPLHLPPHAVAKERDLYVVETPDGQLDDSIERMLAERVEGPFINPRNIIVYGRAVGLTGDLGPEDESALAFFLAFQYIRTPRFRQAANLLASFQANLMVRAQFQDLERARRSFEAALGRPFSTQEVAEHRDAFEGSHVFIEPNEYLWLYHALNAAIDFTPMIASLPRMVVDLPPGANMPTSDDPFVLVRRQSHDRYLHGGGLAQPDAEITIPLDPVTVLVLGNALRRYHDQGSREWTQQVRERIVTGSQQWVFVRQPNAIITRLLKTTEPPTYVVEYPGGRFEAGDDAYAAVRDMMAKNPREATIRFGPRD